MARKTKAAVEAAPTETVDAVQAPETPAETLGSNAAKVELLAFDTLLRAASERVAIELSIMSVSVRTNCYGDICHGAASGDRIVSPMVFAAQAGLLMGAARAVQAVEADASDF
jgi:hypothetical protein